LGHPGAFGSDATCGTSDSDYLAAGIRPDYLFANGLD
jgi:hypothetical protein